MKAARRSRVLALSLGGLAAALPFSLLFHLQRLAHSLPAERDAARREGLPLTPDDLRPSPPVADPDNAAPLYRRAARLVAGLPRNRRADDEEALTRALAFRRAVPRPDQEALLARSLPLLALAQQAAQRPHCDYSPAEARSPADEVDAARTLVRLLCARALLSSDAGTWRDALADIGRAARIGRQQGETPTLEGARERIADQSFAHEALLSILRRHGTNPAARKEASSTLEAFGPPLDATSWLRGESLAGRAQIAQSRAGIHAAFLDRQALVCDAREAQWLAYCRALLSCARTFTPASNLPERLQELTADYARGLEGALPARWGPAFAEAMDKIVLTDSARRRLRQQTMALLEIRDRTGAFPEAPLLLDDPFADGPLQYRRVGEGFLLWSIGEDRRNHGAMRKSADDEERDIVVRFF